MFTLWIEKQCFSPFSDHVDKSKFLDAQICPTFSTFEFNDWNEQAEVKFYLILFILFYLIQKIMTIWYEA